MKSTGSASSRLTLSCKGPERNAYKLYERDLIVIDGGGITAFLKLCDSFGLLTFMLIIVRGV